MNIGILKESGSENRVCMLPEAVSALVKSKVSVLVEQGAGLRAFTSDAEYTDAGARIAGRPEILSECQILLGIYGPEKADYKHLKDGTVLLAILNPFMETGKIRELAGLGVTAFSLDVIPRTSRAQSMDVLSSQATVAGYKAVLDAAGRLGGFFQMFMSAAGTIKPAKVMIIGAGVAGLQAIASSRRLGAVVEAFDVRSAVKQEVQSLGAKFIEVEGAREESSAGGYAVEQTEEFIARQKQAIHDHAVKSDVVICTAQIPGKKAPVILTKETVIQMQAGSLVIDLAASSGGNCELTKNNEIVTLNDVRIIGKSDYPSDMPYDASQMLGKNYLNFLKLILDENGGLNLNFADDIVKGTCICHQKEIVNSRIQEIINNQTN